MTRLSDAELVALAALVNAETAGMLAANQERAVHDQSMAYTEKDFDLNIATERLRRELRGRAVIAL